MDAYIVLSRIRASDRKRRLSPRSRSSENAFSTFEHPRQRANSPDDHGLSKSPKVANIPPEFLRGGVACKACSSYVEVAQANRAARF
jgi:hypothetical protein